jgi:hypothetical protein
LAIEPAAGGRQPDGSGQARGPGDPDLHGFPFSRIPLDSSERASQAGLG